MSTTSFFDTLATPKQMTWVREAAAGRGLDADEFSRAKFARPVDELTKAQAYELITGRPLESAQPISGRFCPNCQARLRYDDDRDDEGNIERAYYVCDNGCGYGESAA